LAPPSHIRVRIDGKLPIVFAEQVRMQQLFQNLISNAIKFMDKPQGKIVISAATNHDNLCHITVSDNGPGIEEKYHQKIFQIFQTLGPQTNDTDSTGIGLSLVKKIIELHGGTIEVKSEPGKGSQFIFTLAKYSPDKMRSK
ncbi:MAG: ATP-binding protein, partial [Desulfocapsaceae bacterium]|nr:ATP-binding protein [Desulfocapsaceae bacterium]